MLSFFDWSRDRKVSRDGGYDQPPLTVEFIRHWAEKTPQALALVIDGQQVDYQTFYRHICGMTRSLSALDLKHGQVVLLAFSNFYFTLLALISLENIGCVSAIAANSNSLTVDPLRGFAACILAMPQTQVGPHHVTHRLTPEWVQSVLTQPHQNIADLLCSPQWDDGVRLTSSSGTSQDPKPIQLNHKVQASWHQYYLDHAGYTQTTRLLIAGSLAVNVFYSRATVCLRLGAAVMHFTDANHFPQTVPTAACMMPLDLEKMLNLLPENFRKPDHLVIHTGGAALNENLRHRALQRFCTAIHNNYGCVETGVLTEMTEEKIGSLATGVEVEIVDEFDHPVAEGQAGILRAKSTTMIDAYWQRPDATAQSFRDGWFYPGDEAIRLADDRIQLLGRRDDLLNLGGIKLPPQPFEQALKNLDWVKDAALVSFNDPVVGTSFGLALVFSSATPPPQWHAEAIQLLQRLSVWISMSNTKPVLLSLNALPYTHTGKLRRKEIREHFTKLRTSA